MVYGIAAILASISLGAMPVSSGNYMAADYKITEKADILYKNNSFFACDGEVNEMVYQTCYIFDERDPEDLANKRVVTEEDMDYLIDHYVRFHPESVLSGMGEAFIRASNETGLDPLFFLALCGVESGWGTSDIHLKLNNPYSFGMYGDGVHNGYKLADSFSEGIVVGAKYIYEKYYKAGQTTLYSMNHKKNHSFCAGDDNWEYQIGSVMAYCEDLLDKR